MTYKQYIEKLTRLKETAERSIIGKLPAIERQAYSLLQDYIDNNLDTIDGKFVANERAVAALSNFTDLYLTGMTELADYKGSVGQYLKNFKSIGTLMEEFQNSNGVNVEQARLGAVQEIVVNETIERYSQNGLNSNFAQPLRELMFDNITGGLSKVSAMKQLREYVVSGKDQSGKLGRYIEQTAQQAVDSYTGAVNVRIMQEFTIDTYVMSGSLIDTSSSQCRFAIKEWGGLIDRDKWPQLKKLAEKEGLIEGTTFDNLPINKLHWGCRHEFTPVILSEAQRKQQLSLKLNS